MQEFQSEPLPSFVFGMKRVFVYIWVNKRTTLASATIYVEFVEDANVILKVRFAQIVFAFAIKFSTFN